MAELGYGEDQCMGDQLELVKWPSPDLHCQYGCLSYSLSAVCAVPHITDSPCGSLLPRVGADSLPSPWSSSPLSLPHVRDSVVQGTVGAVESTYCGGLVVCCQR